MMGTGHGVVGKKCEPLKARFKGEVETDRGIEFMCRPLVGSTRGPCPRYPSLIFRRCLSLLLGREGSVFLDAWCGRTSMRIGWLGISGGRYERGGYGNV